MNQPPAHDDPRDPHLMAALRHAPDRDVLPPAQLTAAILDQARQAARQPGGARAWRDGLRGVFARLWRPAPMAAFGTLAMATLIGVMWSAQESPDATPSLRPSPSALPAAPAGPVPAPQREAAESERVHASPATTVVAPRSTKAAAPPTAHATVRADQAPSSPPPVAASYAAAPPTGELAKSMADAAPARARREVTPLHGAAAAPTAMPATAQGAALSEVADPLAAIDALLMRGAAAVWQAPGASPSRGIAHGETQREWWARLRTATAGRWQAVEPPTRPLVPWLVLMVEARVRGSLWPDGEQLLWSDDSGRTWRAAVDPALLRAWQEAVSRW